MIFTKINGIEGPYLIELEKIGDDRGFFSRAFCKREYEELNLENEIVQINNSVSSKKGTFRGFHYQVGDAQECKIVRCIKGALIDIIIDVRKDSPSYLKSYHVKLSEENKLALYVPKGFAHGFLTTEDNTEALYFVTEYYTPGMERGIRYNDPLLSLNIELKPEVISDKDQNWPNFKP